MAEQEGEAAGIGDHEAWIRGIAGKYLDFHMKGASTAARQAAIRDRKSTRLNSSHIQKSRMPSSA